MAPIVVIALCQLAVLIGGILSAAVANKISTTLWIAHTSDTTGELHGFTGGDLLPAASSLLLDWWIIWILLPLIWVSLAAWIRSRPAFSDGARTASVAGGITMIVLFSVWAVAGGVLPMLNAFARS